VGGAPCSRAKGRRRSLTASFTTVLRLTMCVRSRIYGHVCLPCRTHQHTHTHDRHFKKRMNATHTHTSQLEYTRPTEHEHTPNSNLLASYNSSSVPVHVANVTESSCCSLRWVRIKVACPWLQSSMCMQLMRSPLLFGIHNGCGTACLPHVPPAAARTTTTTVDDRPSPLTRPQLDAVIELLDAGADPNAEVGKHGMVRGPHSNTVLKLSFMPLYACCMV
jgi:hypothetical protein